MKKKKALEAIKFVAVLLVGMSVVLSLFAPFMLSYSHN